MRIFGQTSSSGAISESTWSARGAGSYVGELKRISDIGFGALMQWDGTYWRVTGETLVYSSIPVVSGIRNTNVQILKSATLPAGLMRSCSVVTMLANLGRSGTTDTTTVGMRVGSAGTSADTSLGVSSLGSGNRQVGGLLGFSLVDSTTIRVQGNAANLMSGWNGAVSTTVMPRDITVSDMDSNPLYLTIYGQKGADTANEVPEASSYFVYLHP